MGFHAKAGVSRFTIRRCFKMSIWCANRNIKKRESIILLVRQNAFNLSWIEKVISAKIEAINNQDEEPKTATVPKKILYNKFPFMSKTHNKKFQSSLKDIVGWYYPQIDLRLIFSNRHSIASMFPFKDSIPLKLRSNVVYKYTCGICNSIYIGETTRHFYTRCREHEGYSPRTGNAYRNPPNSNIYKHQQETGHIIELQNFKILLTTDPHNH